MSNETIEQRLSVKTLESGYVLVRGNGPCEWAQPRCWPCSEDELRRSAFPEASEKFIQQALHEMMGL